jgi:magnesium-transporting ATPase (P-type)
MKIWQRSLNKNIDATYLFVNFIIIGVVLIFVVKLFTTGNYYYNILPPCPKTVYQMKELVSSYTKKDLLKIVWYFILMIFSYALSLILLYSVLEGIVQFFKRLTSISLNK